MLLLNLNKYSAETVINKGEKFYLCHSRKKLIKATPEEEVRQKLIKFLKNELNVPEKMLEVEFPVSRIEKESRLRADIVVFELIEGKKAPLFVIECKESTIPLCNGVYEQLRDYDDILEPTYIAMTNGEEFYIEKYNEIENKFYPLKSIPKYSDMLLKNGDEDTENINWQRCEDEDYDNLEFLTEMYYFLFNIETDDSLKREIVKLADVLYDTSYVLENEGDEKLYIKRDNGKLIKTFGNSGGGDWNGLYRIFLVKYKDEYYTVSIGLNVGYLLVGIENNNKKHHSLQLRLTKNVLKKGKNRYMVVHNGRMSAGNKGSIKNQIVIDYIKEKAPRLVNENKIVLGELKLERKTKIYEIKKFLYNLIEYSLLRDEIREQY